MFCPHVFLHTWIYSSNVVEEFRAITEGFGDTFFMGTEMKISKTISYLDSDHILYPSNQQSLTSWRIVSVIGWRLTLLLSICVAVLPLVCSLTDVVRKRITKSISNNSVKSPIIKQPNRNWFEYSNSAIRNSFAQPRKKPFSEILHHYFWCTLVTVFGCAQLHLFRRRKCLVLLIWIFSIHTLQNLLIGDMIGAMANRKKQIVIDSWDDLVERDDVQKIIAFNLKTFFGSVNTSKENYFSDNKYKQTLTPKLDLIALDNLLNTTQLNYIMQEASKGHLAVMYTKPVLELFAVLYPNLHVSQSGGRTEPYFLMSNWYTTPKMNSAMDTRLVQF